MGATRGRRTGMILILIILIVLVAVVAIGYLLLQGFGGGGGGGQAGGGGTGATEVPTATPLPVTVNIIVAAHDIARGTRLSIQDVTIVAWPIDVPRPLGALEVGTTIDSPGLEQVEGRIARVDILNGQPVLDHMLTPSDQPTGLGNLGSDAALVIPAGQVAVAFPLDRLSGVAYAVRPGDHVDILMSFRFVDVDEDFQTTLPNNVGYILWPATITTTGPFTVAGREEDGPFGTKILLIPSEQGQRPRQVTQLVIDNAIVLRVGSFPLTDLEQPIVVTAAPQQVATPPPAEGGATPVPEAATSTPVPALVPDIITLIMSRQDALVLKYALETGADIDLALRSVLDNEVTDVATDSVTLQYIIDFYNVAQPPRMPIAHDPRIDLITQQTGSFAPAVIPVQATPAP